MGTMKTTGVKGTNAAGCTHVIISSSLPHGNTTHTWLSVIAHYSTLQDSIDKGEGQTAMKLGMSDCGFSKVCIHRFDYDYDQTSHFEGDIHADTVRCNKARIMKP